MNRQLKKKIWVCNDLWMDILPSFDRPQLGLKMALLSDRFDVLVDAHFDGKSEVTIWREITIRKGVGPTPKLSVLIDDKLVAFPLPDHPLPNKIRFKNLLIDYIDYSVIEFLRSNKHIWDRMGTKLELFIDGDETEDVQPIWDVLAREIWPIFASNIRHLSFFDADDLDNLRRHISPTILTDCDQLNFICSYGLFPDAIADDGPNATIALLPDAIGDDGPNATAGQVLSKWLHTPSKDGQPKRLFYRYYSKPPNLKWINNLKEAFPRALSSASYIIRIDYVETMPTEPFELENERTKEKLTLINEDTFYWLLKRCPIGETEATVQWENDGNLDHLNAVRFVLWAGIGPLSPPTDEEADQSNKNVV